MSLNEQSSRTHLCERDSWTNEQLRRRPRRRVGWAELPPETSQRPWVHPRGLWELDQAPHFPVPWDRPSSPLSRLTGHVRFIDYEYAGYNYQAFDIGNHFNEFAGERALPFRLCPRYFPHDGRPGPGEDESGSVLQNLTTQGGEAQPALRELQVRGWRPEPHTERTPASPSGTLLLIRMCPP